MSQKLYLLIFLGLSILRFTVLSGYCTIRALTLLETISWRYLYTSLVDWLTLQRHTWQFSSEAVVKWPKKLYQFAQLVYFYTFQEKVYVRLIGVSIRDAYRKTRQSWPENRAFLLYGPNHRVRFVPVYLRQKGSL
ncbi:hypothetical protein M0L20_29865 [Spirosoma sp. RP8]|uniref:Secreted protein n=1 Tax=Spirosoma liriopis TaxID=2937440 RepID=A0ABT0HVA2_9BACT|nr:hypothetical protein [Spirosoma liriopis]MCK8496111.1 hypothetical protein [Spirosoma liriopis]